MPFKCSNVFFSSVSLNHTQRVETKRRNTVVVIYFDYLDRREVCPTLHAYKIVKVTGHQLVPVIMYDYYDNGELKQNT